MGTKSTSKLAKNTATAPSMIDDASAIARSPSTVEFKNVSSDAPAQVLSGLGNPFSSVSSTVTSTVNSTALTGSSAFAAISGSVKELFSTSMMRQDESGAAHANVQPERQASHLALDNLLVAEEARVEN